MATAQRHEDGPGSRRVLVTNAASNMISSLHPSNRGEVSAALAEIEASVLDPAKVREIAGNLRVVFTKEGDLVVVTSVVTRDLR